MPAKLTIWDQRMLMLMDHCIDMGLVDTQKEFCESLGMFPNAIHAIRKKERGRGFTIENIHDACKKYDINVNWIMGFEQNMSRKQAGKTAIKLLKEAVTSIEAELNAVHASVHKRTQK